MLEDHTPLLENPILRSSKIERREYQINIAERAIKKNTLIVLPTALGKTIIAVLVAAHFLYHYSDKKVLMMAPTRPLVLQHWENFLRLLKIPPAKAVVLTGKTPPAYRMRVWEGDARLYFCTPQVVANDCSQGLKLDQFSLLIFDECHRARKNYAYTKVARTYAQSSSYPMVLAMTASPGSDRKKIEELCKALYIEHIEIRTEEDPDVSPYMASVGVERIHVDLPGEHEKIRAGLKRILKRRLGSLVEIGAIRKKPEYISRRDLLELGARISKKMERERRRELFGILLLQASAMTLFHALELLETQGIFAFKKFVERLLKSPKRSHRSVVNELSREGILEMISRTAEKEHPKLEKTVSVVKEQIEKNPNSKIIVFTQYRETSKKIVDHLTELGLPAERFVGQAKREGEAGMTQEEQAEILRRFRNGEIKVLVATSVGEEGLDIPAVDLVVFYEPVPSEIRYIQRKGRTGRQRVGRVVILTTTKTLDETYFWSTRHKLRKMKREIGRLNMELHPILRFGNPPEPNPLKSEEIREFEPPTISEMEESEKIKLKKFNREVMKTAKLVLKQVLEMGRDGITIEELIKEFEARGISQPLVGEAVGHLLTAGELIERGGRLLPPSAVGEPNSHLHMFEVEKVMVGRAVLVVDNKWRSILIPQEYSGPRELIRRGVKFQAAAEFYRQEGKLHARIHSVERILS